MTVQDYLTRDQKRLQDILREPGFCLTFTDHLHIYHQSGIPPSTFIFHSSPNG